MNRLKVTEGDSILISFTDDISNTEYVDALRNNIASWLKSRGMRDVKIITVPHADRFLITILSVNDVFEEQILKGGDND